MFVLGIKEAWGFWSTTAVLIFAIVYLAASASNLTFEAIAVRWRKKRNCQREAELRAEVQKLKAQLYDVSADKARILVEGEHLRRQLHAAHGHADAIARGA